MLEAFLSASLTSLPSQMQWTVRAGMEHMEEGLREFTLFSGSSQGSWRGGMCIYLYKGMDKVVLRSFLEVTWGSHVWMELWPHAGVAQLFWLTSGPQTFILSLPSPANTYTLSQSSELRNNCSLMFSFLAGVTRACSQVEKCPWP